MARAGYNEKSLCRGVVVCAFRVGVGKDGSNRPKDSFVFGQHTLPCEVRDYISQDATQKLLSGTPNDR